MTTNPRARLLKRRLATPGRGSVCRNLCTCVGRGAGRHRPCGSPFKVCVCPCGFAVSSRVLSHDSCLMRSWRVVVGLRGTWVLNPGSDSQPLRGTGQTPNCSLEEILLKSKLHSSDVESYAISSCRGIVMLLRGSPLLPGAPVILTTHC